jgi:NAD(P)H dehydrogenase (quinone)
MIVVTGATGKLGTMIVRSLLNRLPASQIGVSVRDPEAASTLRSRGVRVRHGDFAQPDTLRAAFDGATMLLIVSSNAAAHGGDPIPQHRAAIDAAKASGIERLFYTSHAAAGECSAFPPMRTHARTEAMMAESGLKWTALRNGFYSDAACRFLGDWQQGTVNAPADGKVAWTAHQDLADAAAELLVGEQTFHGPTPPLTGSEALSLGDLAAIGSDILGKMIDRQVVPDEKYRIDLEARGLPSALVDMTLGFYEASRRGEFSVVDPMLEALMSRRPKTMREVLADIPRPRFGATGSSA